jgi:hypothetical protein
MNSSWKSLLYSTTTYEVSIHLLRRFCFIYPRPVPKVADKILHEDSIWWCGKREKSKKPVLFISITVVETENAMKISSSVLFLEQENNENALFKRFLEVIQIVILHSIWILYRVEQKYQILAVTFWFDNLWKNV